ncbi:uncharacterized protein LOC123923062 [Trifolium pratense]|uniref:uncharacterized protein LOC123923062 n=1 Tax=Trifolium pratense TaxID=57577 RepID=UPI001E6962B9|nr:uncharacterized protein LOC123923062 [Trifolium pratense]
MEEASAGAIFPNEVIVEIVSWLPVKYVMQLRCLNKFFNTLIFNPNFVQMHLNKSTRTNSQQLALICFENEKNHVNPEEDWTSSLITLSIHDLLQNHKFTIFHHSDPYYLLTDRPWLVGSCNGLLCLFENDGVHYLNGTINWIAVRDDININGSVSLTVDQFVILSLDLSTETYTELLLPQRFDKVPRYPPKLVVLMDCLCFCHDFQKIHFVIWQMKDFGVQESWIQLFKISHQDFYIWLDLLPLYLSENGDTLLLANVKHNEAFIYNCRDNKVEKIGIANNIMWPKAKDYVESLVSPH